MIELLSPVGNFECLKAAVQNGADSVYFGSDNFSARAFATNFDISNLQKVIEYAKLRGVKTHLALNTLIKDNEFEEAFNLAKKAYEFGIDAIIVQDLGLGIKLINEFPDLPIHASTQMTVHNLNGALELQDLGFKRVVLSRELSVNDIDYICKNTNIQIETFIHGALCISYSGQCLFSSMLGGRSGNRGKCAGPCRLPFKLLENEKPINSGYLLNTKDLCGLDYIPDLIKAGVKCFKIEGRMKKPEYVAIVTGIYRKYIDLVNSNKPYIIDENDRKALLQIYNRGMSSPGHLSNEANRNLVFKEKPNNMGLFLGKVQKYNNKKGYITIKLNEPIQIGDTIAIGNETTSYTISELMDINNNNITSTKIGDTVIVGRIKGNIELSSKIYKMTSKSLNIIAKKSYSKEYRKVMLNCEISIKKDKPINVKVSSASNIELYKNLHIDHTLTIIPEEAKSRPLDKQTIIKQFSKTNSSLYEFKNIQINLDDNLFLPGLSILNELRRTVLDKTEQFAINEMRRKPLRTTLNKTPFKTLMIKDKTKKSFEISILLNILNEELDYSKLENVDNIYIPLKYFINKKYSDILHVLNQKFNLYLYMPTIVKSNYKNLFIANIGNTIKMYNIKGIIISNICNFRLLHSVFNNTHQKFDLITNYTFNIYNNYTVLELKKLGVSKYTISPESNKEIINNLSSFDILPNELIVYGKIPVINMNYCVLGETDKCYPTCKLKCQTNNRYYLNDRLNMKFRIMPDNIQTVTTIFNSKTTSLSSKDFNVDCFRIDILDEDIDTINNIVLKTIQGSRFEGKKYTNGNLNRDI